MAKFGQLFASPEAFAIMLRMVRKSKNLLPREEGYLRRVSLGGRPAVVDLRLLTTTRSRGI